MKKLLIGTSFLLGSLIAPTFADEINDFFADEKTDFYLSVGGGIAFPSDIEGDFTSGGTKYDAKFSTDDPFIYSFALGKEFKDWRLEFNYSGSTLSSNSFTVTTGGTGVTASLSPEFEVKAKSYMIYGYKDFKTSDSKTTPYFGVGLGTSNLSTENQTLSVSGTNVTLLSASESVFSYAVKGGIGYQIADNTTLYSEATYINYASFSTDANENYDSNNHFGITAGLRYSF